ncbi:MAG: bifunctional (p)ppGpp synthetase/guanosine-3',5'-bis(diphosphate) 3'-pyrophosphohydrolase [Ruminococcus sp.]|uniref:RelA/SpoT family protein n=1 Tax=Ruminococcus sp. JE7B6 TaxID=3233380 RepID=UPI00164C1EFB|nr:RelA/SpoT family protein [uncultured Ruminococcus sp.]MBQ1921496.1 bifunctional (p)ppGpp synthetase/guanosine-3',5'-bis(diphosphate) 3'-pyrophosphohydrolase [Ruminococcus sp.]MDO4891916.1 bifunctional (p)ppGpp synthetase/guanosine-3',5'-bis(diphosphate) 3'-pyrophosphohydrolase [Eubacteriales bacterium]MBQ2279997.1 bifunctional (p)ppGpp synthetase/guanosine-3',5'-bis(diphosphate) 3'-pyrophosphohydrolase [Ruminococcus sp.]MBQ2537317.1 bifunctional (p)ppGpp synthetase/guanosine-3',5'-bis(diphos
MSRFSNVAHYQDYSELEHILETSNNNCDMEKIRSAYSFAEKCHGDQRRVSGIPYILHPTSVACIVAELGMDTDTICGALLHDTVEDTYVTLEEVGRRFGADVAKLIDGVTKISKIPYSSREEQQAENIRKMLIAMADDIRVIIIKLADRLHNMRTMDCMPEQKRRDKSLENMQVFAPIAHRLGIKAIKDELEDRSLQYLDPIGYSEIENTLLMNEEGRDKFIEEIKAQLLAKTKDTIKNVFISGRVKSINSIYRKTFMRGQSIDQIFDVFAVRVIVDNVSDCYNVLGVVHDIFKPIPNRFKDYISMPKPNMYQSLHTTVLDKNAIPFEVQIRTWEMHYTAEYGIAAHWKYKLGMDKNGKVEDRLHKNIENVRKMILEQLQTEDATDIARNIRNDFEENDVYVFTPKGDVMSLPRGSTPIDLAYLIHTQVGHRMVGAKINNKIVSIDYKLRTGDICEILTQKEEHPNRAWIDICKTASAKSKIRQWFKHEKRDENIVEGKAMIEREFKRQGMNLTEEEYPEFFRSVSVKKQYNTLDDFYAAVGYGGIQLWKIMPRLREEYQKTYASDLESITVPPVPEKRSKASSGVIIEGNDDVLVKFSNCCNPLPGDEIIGYITRGYGVSIHKRTCTNVPKDISQSEEPERWVSCFWEEQVDEAFRSTLQITATDRSGLLADVTVKLSTMHINIHTLNSREVKNNKAVVTVTIDVMGRNHLRGVISRLSDINGIEEIKRL